MNSLGAATPIDLSGVYKVVGLDTWDNFVIEAAEGVLHRYALFASKGLEQERHLQAALRHAVSNDDGVSWQNLGVVLEASRDGSWPDLVIWGSNGVYRDVPGGGKEFLLFVTGRSKADGELQRIGLAKSDDGHEFSRPKVILDPTSRMGYDITGDDNVLMAWRDPFVFRDHEDDRWHMLFAAKAAMPAGPPIATVGHAIAKDDDLEQWELQSPLQLPRHYRQLEVPSLVQRPGRYCLFVSTQNYPDKSTNKAKQTAFRGYVAPSLLGPWEFIYGETDLIYGHKIYAPLVFKRGQSPHKYAAVAFFSENTTLPITATPLIDIEWEMDKHLGWERPVFDFVGAVERFF